MMTAPLAKYTILYADDDEDDLLFVTEAFSRYVENVEIITVPDGAEAIEHLKRMDRSGALPCLIILDVNMPRMNGKETLAQLRKMESCQATPVVFFTTSSLPLDREFAKLYNAYFRTKPLHLSEIRDIADEFLAYCADEIKKAFKP